ncbi:MAG: hypothetical protein M3177_07020 [Pseudomonadota bacterium]|nr:hypothetical protein [Pseudomonadota bacterium]
MSLQDDSRSQRRRKPDSETDAAADSSRSTPKKKARPGEVGNALRSAYQRMVDEDIPPEMLDLLGKLG